MSERSEGHSAPEAGPPGGLVEVLVSWERGGGQWQVLEKTAGWISIQLRMNGRDVSRISGARTSVLETYFQRGSSGVAPSADRES
jgi:hypothetical protein